MKLEIYSESFNAAKADIRLVTTSLNAQGIYRSYRQCSADKLITPAATFTCTQQGHKWIQVGGQTFYLPAGEVLYIPANSVVFSYLIPNQEGLFSSLSFSCPSASDKLPENPEGAFRFTQEQLKMYLPKVFSRCATELKEREKQRMLQVVSHAVFTETSLPDLASACCMSLATFKRKFKTYFSVAPGQWLQLRKLESAYFDLRFLKKSISEASIDAGFESLSHFSYSFKKRFGTTPSSVLASSINLS